MALRIIRREVQKKNRRRVNLFLSDGRVVGASVFILHRFDFKEGGALSLRDLRRLRGLDLVFRGKEKALKLISRRPRSEREIKIALKKYFRKVLYDEEREFENRAIEKIIKQLKKKSLLNDREFCFWWIDQRTRFRPSSRRKIAWELKSKGVDLPVIDDALDKFGLDEVETGRRLLKKYLARPSFRKLTSKEARNKSFQWLYSKGFSYQTIRQVIDDEAKFK